MGFLVLILAILAAGFFANVFSRLRDLQALVQESHEKLADRIRQLETRLGAQERQVAQLHREAARTAEPRAAAVSNESAPQAPSAAVPPPIPPPIVAQTAAASSVPAAPPPGIPEPPPVLHPVIQPVIRPVTHPVMQPVAAREVPHQPPSPPAEPQKATPEAAHAISIEERFGTNWLNKIGIAFVVMGVAFFLAYHLMSMGPGGKVLTGLIVSLGFLGGGLWLERKPSYRIFARASIGGGWALLFFTAFAMHHVAAARVIQSLILDLLLMLLIAAGMVLHSLRYRSQTVTGLAFLLGYAALATSHFESASGTVVFSLLASAVLALGLVIVTTLRHWAWLELAGLVGVLANHFLWLSLVLPATRVGGSFPLFAPSAALIVFYWVIFRAAYLLRKPLDATEDRISSLTAVVTGAGILGLLKYQSAHPEWAFLTLLVLGTIEMLLGIWSRKRRHSAFVVLTTIGTVLLVAAVPYQFHGVSWPILWLAEAHVLALCGLRLGEPIFRRLGLLAGFGASLVLAVHDILPLANFRLEYPDPGHHPSLAVALALAAALFWLHGEIYPRRWPEVAAQIGEAETIGLAITSWLGLGCATAALWVVLPAQWVAVGWLALVLLLGHAADWKSIVSLALQADVLAALSIPALFVWDFEIGPRAIYKIPSALAVALLYAGMRRRTTLENSPNYVAPVYSWVASLLLVCWMIQAVPDQWVILTFAAGALLLFEIGRSFQQGYLRWQGFLLATLAAVGLQVHFVERLFASSMVHGWFALPWPDPITVLAVISLTYWLQERSWPDDAHGRRNQIELAFAFLMGAFGTLSVALWLHLILPSWGTTEAEPVFWAFLASTLLAVALMARRRVFQLHGIALSLFVAAYSVFLAATGGEATGDLPWWQSNLFRMGLAAAILLAGLPIAFRLRQPWAADERWSNYPAFLRRPEQWFFFVPYGVMILTLAVELRSGNLTLGWSLLGLGAFLFAIFVGERSFRLAGLALLLTSVVKILLMDVWTLAPPDRYTTLIVMGCALLLVSFLYTRFREVFRRYL